MSTFEFSPPEVIDQDELDLLTDGELGESAYRDLIGRLEEAFLRGNGQPWRRCALALLEAQALQRELGGLRKEIPEPNASSVASAFTQAPRQHWIATALACAASFLLAIALSAGAQRFVSRSAIEAEVAQQSPGGPSQPGQEDHDRVLQHPTVVSPPVAENSRVAWRPTGNLTLTVAGEPGAAAQRVEVPIYSAADGDVPPLWSIPAGAPQDLLEALEKAGHRITLRRQVWPVKLDDGRQVVVPVEQVVVAPLGANSFQ